VRSSRTDHVKMPDARHDKTSQQWRLSRKWPGKAVKKPPCPTGSMTSNGARAGVANRTVRIDGIVVALVFPHFCAANGIVHRLLVVLG